MSVRFPGPCLRAIGAHALRLAPLVLLGCSSGAGDPGTAPATPVARLTVQLDTARLTLAGTVRVAARAVDASGAPIAQAPVVFTVRDTVVAAVSADGVLRARRFGATVVTARAGSASVDVPVIVQFDQPSLLRQDVPGGPFGLAVNGDVVVVTLKDADRLAVGTVEAGIASTIPVGAVPTDVALARDGRTAYVTNQASGTLGIVDLARASQVATVDLAASPFRSVLARSGAHVWVTTSVGGIHAVDPTTRTVATSLRADDAVNGFVVAPGDTLAYASTYGGRVHEFDLRTRALRRTFGSVGRLQEVVVSGDGRELYVANEAGGVEVWDLASGGRVATLPLGLVFGMALGPDGRTLFVGQALEGTIAAVDRVTRTVLFRGEVGGSPRRLAFARDGRTVVVANEGGWIDLLR